MEPKVDEILEIYGDAFVETIHEGLTAIGLGNSALYKSTRSEAKGGVLQIAMFDYAKYVISGRRAGAKKVPISALIKWIKQKGLTPRAGQSINQLAFAIQTAIFKRGIKGRPFLSKGAIIALTRQMSKKLADTVVKYIDSKIEKQK